MPETQADAIRAEDDDARGGHILDRIVRTKRKEIAELAARASELRSRAADAAPARDLEGMLRAGLTVSLIAEVKRRSPGAGAIRPELDPVELATAYASAGASAISVLTDAEYFQGSLADLTAVRSAVPVPVLRKDFVLHESQVWEARAAGADAILLIVRILDDGPLSELRELAQSLGMASLVEAHDAAELERALDSGARVVGINNRDLSSFTTRVETTLDLVSRVPGSVVLVSESGICAGEDVERLGEVGVDATLVGEALVRANDPAGKVGELISTARRSRGRDDGGGHEARGRS